MNHSQLEVSKYLSSGFSLQFWFLLFWFSWIWKYSESLYASVCESYFMKNYWIASDYFLFFFMLLQSLLRRMNFPLIRRNRIIESIWHFGFNLGSAYFLKLTENSSGEHVELCLRFYESFYLHTAAIHAFSNGNWMQAAHDFLFATSLFSFTNKT